MKECRSNSAAFGGPSFFITSGCFSLFGLLFPQIQRLWSYLHTLRTMLYVCWLVSKSNSVSPLGGLDLWDGYITWAKVFHCFLRAVSRIALNPCFTHGFGTCPRASYVPDPWGAEHLAGIVSACCSKWMSKGCERAACYEAASQEYVGFEMVSGVAAYMQS